MKKIVLFVLLLTTSFGIAQKKEKIKGNREVLIKKFVIPSFHALELGEKFKVNIQKATDTTRVIIETDDNLFDVIHYSVEDGVLKFYTSMEIVKKKRLRITVFVPGHFDKIKLKEKAKVYNEELLNLQKLQLETTEKSEADLNMHIQEDLDLKAMDKSELKLELIAKKANAYFTGNSRIEGKLNIKTLTMNANDHAYVKLEGNVEQLSLKANDKAKVKADKLIIKEAEIKNFDKTDISVNVSGNIKMSLSGQSETYLYGSPKIKLKQFEDNAILYKK